MDHISATTQSTTGVLLLVHQVALLFSIQAAGLTTTIISASTIVSSERCTLKILSVTAGIVSKELILINVKKLSLKHSVRAIRS